MSGFDMRKKYAIFALPFLDWRIDDNCMQIISQQQMLAGGTLPWIVIMRLLQPHRKKTTR